MAVRHGVTESQIAGAVHEGLPHLSDPSGYLQDSSAGHQSEEERDKGKGKHADYQGKKKRITIQAA